VEHYDDELMVIHHDDNEYEDDVYSHDLTLLNINDAVQF
jgi:hypothetical protein